MGFLEMAFCSAGSTFSTTGFRSCGGHRVLQDYGETFCSAAHECRPIPEACGAEGGPRATKGHLQESHARRLIPVYRRLCRNSGWFLYRLASEFAIELRNIG